MDLPFKNGDFPVRYVSLPGYIYIHIPIVSPKYPNDIPFMVGYIPICPDHFYAGHTVTQPHY